MFSSKQEKEAPNMGAMNKHPSCRYTWPVTTRGSFHVSEALAFLMLGNAHLEEVLLAEFSSLDSQESMLQMVEMVRKSRDRLIRFRADLLESIKLGEERGNPYEGDFKAINERMLAMLWGQTTLAECEESVKRIGNELKLDHLATARRFVYEVEDLIRTAGSVVAVFETARIYAEKGCLKSAIENGEFPLQVVFAEHYSHFLVFMREYLVDSLVATEVVFRAKGKSLLAS